MNGKLLIKVGILLFAFIFAYKHVFSSLVEVWLTRDDYSYGILIPFISLYFIYAKRKELKKVPLEPKMSYGLVPTMIGGIMLLSGSIGSVITLQQYSIIVIIPGLVLMLFGIQFLKAVSFPLVYLIFMIPNLDNVFIKLRLPLQLLSAKMASVMLGLLNIPVLQYAQYLELPGTTLEVADACSGLNYLMSIIAIGIPLAYFTQKNWLSRIVLILFALIVSIFANSVRIAFIGMWVYNGGEDLHGPSHIFRAFFVSVIGFVFLFIAAWILSRFPLRMPNFFHKNKKFKVID
jgi:exosortase